MMRIVWGLEFFTVFLYTSNCWEMLMLMFHDFQLPLQGAELRAADKRIEELEGKEAADAKDPAEL